MLLDEHRRIDAGDDALCRSLLVARRTVGLPRREEAADILDLQRRLELRRVDAVVLDGIARAHDVRVLEARYRLEEGELHIHRHARAHALHVDFIRVQALRLKEELMAVLVGEAQDLCLDGRAVARADALDDAVGHRRAVHVVAQDLVRRLIRIGQPARHLLARLFIAHEREVARLLIARLDLHLIVVERARIDAGRRARLEAHEADARRLERIRELHRRALPVRAAAVSVLADDDAALEIRARRHDDGRREVDLPRLDEDAAHSLLVLGEQQVRDEDLLDIEVLCLLARLLHRELVELLVRLRAQRMDGRALARVEHAELYAGLVRIDAHLAAERIELAHEMAFARAADRRVAGHQGNIIHRERRQKRSAADARSGQRLHAGMASADDDDIV